MKKIKGEHKLNANFPQLFTAFCLTLMLFISISYAKNPLNYSKGKFDQMDMYRYNETREVVRLVNDAVQLIEKNGKKIFPKFRIKNSKWYKGSTYVFVWDLDGMRYVYPRDPEGEGKNMLNLKDIKGRPIGKMFTDTAKSKNGEGWVFYQWTKPGQDEPIWKATFIKKAVAPTGKKYLVGCGEYNLKMEKEFLVQIVNDAALDFENDRKAAFKKYSPPNLIPSYLNTYIFVKNMKGIELLNPNTTEILNKNILDLQDAKGKYFVKKEIEILRKKDTCWMDYYWPKPNEKEPSYKVSFFRKVPSEDEVLIIGAGFYPEFEEHLYAKKEISRVSVHNMATGIGSYFKVLKNQNDQIEFLRTFLNPIRFFKNNTGYFYVYEYSGMNVSHATQPEKFQGKNLWDYQDPKGTYVIRELAEIAKNGGGYLEYYWNDPKTNKQEKKLGYVEPISGTNYFIGDGIYYNDK